MFALGIAGGILFPDFFVSASFVGDIYVNLLKLMAIPVLMCGIACGVYNASKKAVGITLKTVILFIVMFVVSFLITSVVVLCLGSGKGFVLPESEEVATTSATLSSFFQSIFTSNIFSSMSAGQMLPCILFSFVFGFAASRVSSSEKLMEMIGTAEKVLTKMLEYIMYLTPAGVLFLMGKTTASYGISVMKTCLVYILTAWGCSLVVLLLVMVLPAWIFAKISPFTYIRKVYRLWIITLSTCSSAATLPNTIRVCNEEFGVPSEITSLTVPLGCTIHMCGGAVSFCLLGLFTANAAGIQVTPVMFITMLAVSTVINMAAPGLPGGGIVIGATYLYTMGLPVGFIGIYSGIYRLLDMVYTTLNVTGDVTANILISSAAGKKEKKH